MTRLDRAFALCGVAFVVTLIAVFAIVGSTPDSHDSIAKVAAFYAKHHSKLETAGFLIAIPAALFALFMGAVRQRLRRADSGSVAASTAALAGGTIAAGGLMLFGTTQVALADGAGHVTASGLQTLNVIANNSFEPAIGGFGVFLLAAGVAILQAATLPRAMGYVAIVLGVLVFTPIGWWSFLASLIWTVVASVMMAIRPPAPVVEPQPVATPAGERIVVPAS
jgi:hypothetical protein